MFDNKLFRFAQKDLIKVAESTQMAIASQRKKSELAIKAATDFLIFREYVCGQANMPHMLEWHRALNTNESNGNLINIAGDDISILSPRGSSKSTWLCQWLAWVIGTHANAGIALKIVYISYVVTLAISKSRQIKSIIESPLYQDVFPNVRPGAKWTEGEWQIDLDILGLRTIDEPYTLACAGLSGSIVGKRSHLILFDDLIKQKSDATSRPIQEKMIDNYNNGIKFIRFPESRAINLGTRFAKHDIYNKIFVAPYYRVVHQSALLTDENGQEYSYWEPDNINSTFGYPLSLLQKERATDYESFLLQRQNLIPQDDVDGITKEHIKHGFLPGRFEQIIIGGDLAGSVEKYSDATALCVIGINNEYVYVCDAWEEKLKGNWDKAKRIYEFWEKWHGRCKNKVILALDANKYSSLLKQDLEQWLDNPKLFKLENESFNDDFCNIFIEDVASAGRGKEKMDRMNSHSALFQNGRIIFNNIKEEMPNGIVPLDKMINEIIDHDSNESNDLMDSLEVAIYKGREFISSKLSVAN
jgi:hypothetical protein